jgi:protein TonB
MSVHAGLISDLVGPRFHKREVALWSGAAVLVVAAHVGSAWLIHQSSPLPPPPDEAPPAIMLEMIAPTVVMPNAVPLDMAEIAESQATESVEEPVETAEPVTEEMDPVEETEVAEAVPEEVQEVAPDTVETEQAPEVVPEETITEAEEVVPDLVEVPLPEVAMAIPEPRPEIEEPKPVVRKKADQKPAREKPAENKPAEKTTKKTPPKPSVSAQKSAQNAPRAASARSATAGAGASASDIARWQSQVRRKIQRTLRSMNRKGDVHVTFTINAGGRLQSSSVSRSSGDARLDREALSMVRRASPVPAPPPGAKLHLTIPINFD